MSRNLFWLSDDQWARIEPQLPTDVRGVGRVDHRRAVSAGRDYALGCNGGASEHPYQCKAPI
jgi:transposase